MAIKPRFADQEGEATAEFAGDAINIRANVVEAGNVIAHRTTHTGRRAIFPKGLAEGPAPFTGGDARLGAGDRSRHDIAVAVRGAL